MKKTFLAPLILAAMLATTLAAVPDPAVSHRVEFGIYREITVNSNGLVVQDLFQRLNKGKLSHTLLTVTPNSNPTQKLWSATAHMIDQWGGGYTNIITTNSQWYTNGTVDHDIQTEWYLEEERVHYLGSGVSGHSKTTNSYGTVKTTIAANTLWVWISNETNISSYCTNNTKPYNVSAFLYSGYIGSNTLQLFPACAVSLAVKVTNAPEVSPPQFRPVSAGAVRVPTPINELWTFQARQECWHCPEDTNGQCWNWSLPTMDDPEDSWIVETNIWRWLNPSPSAASGFNGTFSTKLDGGLYTNTAYLYRTQDFIGYSYLGLLTPTNGVFTWRDTQAPSNQAFYYLSPDPLW